MTGTTSKLVNPDDDVSFVHPTSALDINQWRTSGYSLVEGLLSSDLINQACSDLDRLAPKTTADFGGVLFPVKDSDAINSIVLHEKLIEGAAQLLGIATSEVRLSQADGWAKIGAPLMDDGACNQDQRIHIDAHNHILVTPPEWKSPVAVAMIVYLSDYVGGGTGIVPRESDNDPAYAPGKCLHTPGGASEFPWINDRRSSEAWMNINAPNDVNQFRNELYSREVVARYTRGSVLFYRHDIWHRGRPLLPGKIRYVLNLSFRRADADYWPSWNQGWPQSNYDKTQFMEKLTARSTVLQRNVLGFPAPGHKYWTEQTLKDVEARYKQLGFDISPYRDYIK